MIELCQCNDANKEINKNVNYAQIKGKGNCK